MNPVLALSHNAGLLLCALGGVIALILLIAKVRLHSFVALIVAALGVGVASRMPLGEIVKAFQDGVGAILGTIAAVVGLGTILGKMLAESGGAERLATTLIQALGEKRLPWTMMLVGFIVGLPVFFAVGLVLLAPVLFNVQRQTRAPLLTLAIPLLAGLSVAHGLVPPHPGPIAAAGILHADIGKTIFWSVLIGLPVAAIGGPMFAALIAKQMVVEPNAELAAQFVRRDEAKRAPGFATTLFTILLPLALMMLATVADVTLPRDHRVRGIADFIGSPIMALLVAVLVSFITFGWARGFTREQMLKFSNDCLGPTAAILLVVGAGGGFNKVLLASGTGDAIASFAQRTSVSPLLFGWFVAALVRLATGSATVAITTAAGIVAPIVTARADVNPELLVIAMGAGSVVLSHLNDGGFWFVKEYTGMTVPQTLKTWTVMETILSFVTLLLVLLVNALLK